MSDDLPLTNPSDDDLAPTQSLPDNKKAIGSQVGPYKLLELIGEGGMGSVYLAQQDKPIKRRVALKLIKSGTDSQQVIARFENERQALALMEHPNIAKFYDAGTASTGNLYFAMEYVPGTPITKFCDEKRLTIGERLKLFGKVCKAVQHAHQKGIIHRDLKPANIVVSMVDNEPVPKVIDFGLAKATGASLTDQTLHTQFGQVLGTLQYMSPEQAGSQTDIDTRTDIHSLGAVLYELLVGSPPFEKETIKSKALDEVVRMIREEDPPTPKQRLESSYTNAEIAGKRNVNIEKMKRLVKGDLEWIVMKALDKERTRRYQTAEGFAVDVQRYLQDEPVSASPPSVLYRIRKFVRRNKLAVGAGAAMAFVLVAAMIGVSMGLLWALKERQVARERTKESEARFDLAIEAIESFYIGVSEDVHLKEPELEELRGRLLGSAQEFYQKLASELRGATTVEKRHDLAEAMYALAQVALLVGAEKDANAAIHDSIELMEELVAQNPTNLEYRYGLASRYLTLGGFERSTSSLENAQISFEKAKKIAEFLVQQQPESADYREFQGKVYNVLGDLLRAKNEREESLNHVNKSLEIYKELVGQYPERGRFQYALAGVYNNLGVAANAEEKTEEARSHFQSAIDLIAPLAAKDTKIEYSDYLARVYHSFAVWHRKAGEPAKAHKLYLKAIETWERLIAKVPTRRSFYSYLGTCHLSLGVWHYQKKEIGAARKSYKQAIEIFEQLVKLSPNVRGHQIRLAQSYDYLGSITSDITGVQETYQKSIGIWDRLVEDDPNDMESQIGRSGALINYGVELSDAFLLKSSLKQLNIGISGLEKLQERRANHRTVQNFLRTGYRSRARVFTDLNRHQEAAQDWLRAANLVSGKSKSIDELYYAVSLGRAGEYSEATSVVDTVKDVPYSAAFSLALLADTAQNDDTLADDDKKRLFTQFSQLAFARLRNAIESGYFQDPSHVDDLRSNKFFDPIRKQEEFKSILKQIEGDCSSAEPNAQARRNSASNELFAVSI